VALADDEREIAASLLWLQRGDAAQRAIAAWTMGWQPALQASGTGWQAPFLSQLLRDPYSAVRRVAFVSLRKLPGYRDFEFDFVAAPDALRQRSQVAFDIWQRLPKGLVDRRGDHVLIDAQGDLQREVAIRLLARRDDRPIRIIE
jgi:hypothetical protein